MRKLWLFFLVIIPLPLSLFIAICTLSEPIPPLDFVMGPFVGHTTSNSTTIWARMPDSSAREFYTHPTRALEHLRVRTQGSAEAFTNVSVVLPDWSSAPVPFSPSDHLIVFRIVNLPSSARVEIEMDFGSGGMRQAAFTTFPALDTTPAKTSFLVGSCRAPDVWSWVGQWSGGDGDKIFRTMVDYETQSSEAGPPSFVLFLGDQIYSDLNQIPYPVLTKAQSNVDFYLGKYRQAFGFSGISQLMSSVPTYMLLDDHDIINDYPGGKPLSQETKEQLYVESGAKQAYLSYQYMSNPLGFSVEAPPFSSKYGGGLDFSFYASSLVRVFALDLRSERDVVSVNMISEMQMDRLIRWLKREDDPLFNGVSVIVSPLVFTPDLVMEDLYQDAWGIYSENQAKIMATIEEETVKSFQASTAPLRTLIVSGDVHSSSWSSLVKNVIRSEPSSSGDPTLQELRVFSVVSSPLAWGGFPYAASKVGIKIMQDSFFNRNPKFRAGEKLGWAIGPKSSDIAFTSNYVRVDVESADKVSVRCRDTDGVLAGYKQDELAWGY